jgi:phage terminase small subunit
MANKKRPLSIREKAFCQYYVELGNGTQAIYKAGYKCTSDGSASTRANQLLKKIEIRSEIKRIQDKMLKPSIMTAEEVMQHFTAIARGEEKDQFGLEISAGDRIKALVEIAKRTVDVENRANGVADHKVEITVDWSRDEDRDIESTEDYTGTDQEE